jgi:hypothetical protein
MNYPVFDYSELLEEAKERIEEKIAIERGDKND